MLKIFYFYQQNGTGPGDAIGRGVDSGANSFYSNIDSMPDIRPRRKSIPLVSELVSKEFNFVKCPHRYTVKVFLYREPHRNTKRVFRFYFNVSLDNIL